MKLSIAFFLLFFFFALNSQATIYWADANGSNTIACSSVAGSTDPGVYATIGRAANCATVAGDSVYIKPGTYTGGVHQIKTDAGTTGLASGTAQAYTTVTGVPGLAKPVINISNWFTTYRPPYNRNYIAVKNVIVDGDCVSQGRGCDGGGAEIYLNGSYLLVEDVEVRNSWNMAVGSFGDSCTWNHHHVIRNSKFQSTGHDGNGYAIYANACDTTFEHNEITNARGGAIQIYYDSPFSVDRPIIRYNYVHNMEISTQTGYEGYCFGIAVDGANVQIDHNILDMSNCANAKSGDGIGTGYGNTSGNATITHNLIYNARSNAVSIGIFSSNVVGNVVKNNILLGMAGAAIMHYGGSTSDASNNKTTGSITDCTVSVTNFAHKSNSSCINAGAVLAGQPYNGSVPDIGPFETCNVSSASISGNLITLNFAMNVNSPLVPAVNVMGFSVNNGRSVASASRAAAQANVIQLMVGGAACISGETWTVTYAPGNISDSSTVGNPLGFSLSQPLFAFTSAVTNACGAGPVDSPMKPSPPKKLRVR